MAEKLSAEQRYKCMSRNRAKDTRPEKMVRKDLFRAGFRFRMNIRKLPGTPDIVLAKYRTAIFVNGCFWHGHEGCKYYTHPKTHPEFWKEKVRRNKERDEIVISRLESLGWYVITIWECEMKKDKFEETMAAVEAQLHKNLDSWNAYQARRKEDRAFALEENRKRREVRAAIEAELQSEYHVPTKIVRLSHQIEDDEAQ